MKVVISDASPLHYLALIEEEQLLPALFGRVIIPQKVFDELQQPKTPEVVKNLAASLPSWLEVRAVSTPIDASLSHLDRGEQEAITLAIEIQADVLLIDETDGRDAAKLCGLRTMGTLRVLYDAAIRNLCDIQQAFDRLKQTNFRATENLYQHFQELYEKSKQTKEQGGDE
jgi:predicted nucleic acid-binding protein